LPGGGPSYRPTCFPKKRSEEKGRQEKGGGNPQREEKAVWRQEERHVLWKGEPPEGKPKSKKREKTKGHAAPTTGRKTHGPWGKYRGKKENKQV